MILTLLCVLSLLIASTPSASAASVVAVAGNCTLRVPLAPRSAAGLATPWRVGGGCHEADPNSAVFVQGVIFDPVANTLSTYDPLVIDQGTTPAIAPTAPVLPPGAIVGLFGGGDGSVTRLIGPGSDGCVNGANDRLFGQVFFCGAANFFAHVRAGHVVIPPLGVDAVTGQPCPTTRSFDIVDQDQSDNVQTTYLINAGGQSAQDTAANRTALGTFTIAKNGSDNRLLTNFVDPAIGCTPWLIPDIADDGHLVATQATDELQAAAMQLAPVARIPAGDPMVRNHLSLLNAYRVNVDQAQVEHLNDASTQVYCGHLMAIAPTFFTSHQAALMASASPTVGMNLYDFLQGRYAASLMLLHCKAVV